MGPFHGLSISLKDPYRVEGLETTIGYIAWLGTKDTKESESYVVTMVGDTGAVFYVKTAVPTGLMVKELAYSEVEDTIANGLVEWWDN